MTDRPPSRPRPAQTHYTLDLATPTQPDALGRSPEQRLRGALKRLLRAYGLRCVSVREVKS